MAERYCRKRSKKNQLNKSSSSSNMIEDQVDSGEGKEQDGDGDEDVVIDLYASSCKRECAETFHEAGKERAMDEVAKLYEMVKSMPEGPQKAHFMKRVSLHVEVCLLGCSLGVGWGGGVAIGIVGVLFGFCFCQFESSSKAGCTPTSVPKKKHMSSLSRLRKSMRRNKVSRAAIIAVL